MIFVECQWITFDDWLFDHKGDNDTLRLAPPGMHDLGGSANVDAL
jgi:hypothetical protein